MVIIETMPGAQTAEGNARFVGEWRALGPLPAVANARVHVLTEDYLLTPSPRGVRRLAQRLCSLLHPEIERDR